ncbi:hypothetical protein BD779DRAFT_1412930, partial [Infundibulicybe gibba]
EELSLISGVYNVYTNNGSQMAQESWWPKYNTWKDSGADVGYWSSFNEVFFQNRLAAIRGKTASLRSAHDWRIALKFDRRTPR